MTSVWIALVAFTIMGIIGIMPTKLERIDRALIMWTGKIAYSLFMAAIFAAGGFVLYFVGLAVPLLGLLLYFFVAPAYVVCAGFCIILPLLPNGVIQAIGDPKRHISKEARRSGLDCSKYPPMLTRPFKD